jgi:hypothetical protein
MTPAPWSGHPQDAEVYWDEPRGGAPVGLQTVTRAELDSIFAPDEEDKDHE